jgi:hypothetical protein
VLDHVRPEEILVADREDGATRLRNLDPAELQQRLEALGVGR